MMNSDDKVRTARTYKQLCGELSIELADLKLMNAELRKRVDELIELLEMKLDAEDEL